MWYLVIEKVREEDVREEETLWGRFHVNGYH